MKAKFFKPMFVIAIPLILQYLFQSSVGALDEIMIGQLGSIEIAAVGLGGQIQFLLQTILFGVGCGGSIFIAQYWGKNDIKGIHRTLGITLTFTLALSALFTIVAVAIPEQLVGLYSADPLVIKYGAQYLRITAFCYIPVSLSFSFALALHSTEQVKLPLYTTIISLSINAVLNYIFIFILELGVQGAAVATVIGELVEFFILFSVSYHKKLPIAGRIKDFLSFTRFDMKKYLQVAFPVILNDLLWSVGISLQNLIMARTSTNAIVAYNIAGTIATFTWVFFIGVADTAAIMIGKKIGEHDETGARNYANRFAWFMPLCAIGIGLLLIPLSRLLPIFFNIDTFILQQATFMLMILMCIYPIKAFNMCMNIGVCRPGGDTVYAGVVDTAFLWLITLPLSAIIAFALKLDPIFIYIAFMSEEILKGISNYVRLRSGKWLNHVTT